MKIAFIWYGIDGRYGIWKDGLWAAMKHIEKEHEVSYFEPTDDILSFNPDIILFWEAACTRVSKDKEMFEKVMSLPYKKYLLFAGGPIKKEWFDGFEHVFVESLINKDEMDMLGISNSVAFGINEKIMVPLIMDKKYDGIHHGTCASWKRQWLVGESLGKTGLVVGRNQESDPMPFERCIELGCTVLPETDADSICLLLNQSHCCLQTSDYWGGGQRCTLEAMACNIPVICMEDSPKNREYVEESGFGLVVPPDANKIKDAVKIIKETDYGKAGREYILSKWTSKHYADNLMKIIK